MLAPPPGATLFPYTTLFRSVGALEAGRVDRRDRPGARSDSGQHRLQDPPARRRGAASAAPEPSGADAPGARGDLAWRCCWGVRSEEHTSELQSRENLVCRLL